MIRNFLFGISIEDEHLILQLGTYIGVSKSVFLPQAKWSMWQGGALGDQGQA